MRSLVITCILCTMAVVGSTIPTQAQKVTYQVTSLLDVGDDNPQDDTYTPQTLRSALENAIYHGTEVEILINPVLEFDTITLSKPLPIITKRCTFIGKGIHINGNGVSGALVFDVDADGSYMEDVVFYGFSGLALGIKCDRSEFRNITCHSNGIGIVLNNAHDNLFDLSEGSSYAGLLCYSNEFGMQIDAESVDNVIRRGLFGTDVNGSDLGNEKAGLLIKGPGTRVERCVFSYNDEEGILIDMEEPSPFDVVIDSCKFHLPVVGYADTDMNPEVHEGDQMKGIFGINAFNVTISNCAFGSHQSYPIDMAGVSVEGIMIKSNWVGTMPVETPIIHQSARTGIRAGGDEIEISENRIAGCPTGISVQGVGAWVFGNKIGRLLDDTTVAPGMFQGIILGPGAGYEIGSLDDDLGNEIIGCARNGIVCNTAALVEEVSISGNYIGSTKGFVTIPVLENGILLQGNLDGVTIDDNRISAKETAVRIQKRVIVRQGTPTYYIPTQVELFANYIGGSAFAIPAGITLLDTAAVLLDNVYDVLVDSNRMYGSRHGIVVRSDSSAFVSIERNEIGFYQPSNPYLWIYGSGVLLERGASWVKIGDPISPALGNVISACQGPAIAVLDSGRYNLIAHNEIFDNWGGSIALGAIQDYYDSGAADDENDADDGPNEFQNAPVFTKYEEASGVIRYAVRVSGTPGDTLNVHVYASVATTPATRWQADCRGFIEQFEIYVGDDGQATFESEITDPASLQMIQQAGRLSATATNTGWSTSQLGTSFESGGVEVDLAVRFDTAKVTESGGAIAATLLVYTSTGAPISSVTVLDSVPASFRVDTVETTAGAVTTTEQEVKIEIPVISAGDTIRIVVRGQESAVGAHRQHVYASSAIPDPDTTNNRDTLDIEVPVVSVRQAVADHLINVRSSHRLIHINATEPIDRVELVDLRGQQLRHRQGLGATRIQIPADPGVIGVIVTFSDGSTAWNLLLVTP